MSSAFKNCKKELASMKVSEIIKPSIAAQIEGKSILAFKEHQIEKIQENSHKNSSDYNNDVNINNRIALLV